MYFEASKFVVTCYAAISNQFKNLGLDILCAHLFPPLKAVCSWESWLICKMRLIMRSVSWVIMIIK